MPGERRFNKYSKRLSHEHDNLIDKLILTISHLALITIYVLTITRSALNTAISGLMSTALEIQAVKTLFFCEMMRYHPPH